MTLIRVCLSASFVFGRVFVHAVVCVCIRGCTSACFVVSGSISRTVAVARVRECMKKSGCHVILIQPCLHTGGASRKKSQFDHSRVATDQSRRQFGRQ